MTINDEHQADISETQRMLNLLCEAWPTARVEAQVWLEDPIQPAGVTRPSFVLVVTMPDPDDPDGDRSPVHAVTSVESMSDAVAKLLDGMGIPR